MRDLHGGPVAKTPRSRCRGPGVWRLGHRSHHSLLSSSELSGDAFRLQIPGPHCRDSHDLEWGQGMRGVCGLGRVR